MKKKYIIKKTIQVSELEDEKHITSISILNEFLPNVIEEGYVNLTQEITHYIDLVIDFYKTEEEVNAIKERLLIAGEKRKQEAEAIDGMIGEVRVLANNRNIKGFQAKLNRLNKQRDLLNDKITSTKIKYSTKNRKLQSIKKTINEYLEKIIKCLLDIENLRWEFFPIDISRGTEDLDSTRTKFLINYANVRRKAFRVIEQAAYLFISRNYTVFNSNEFREDFTLALKVLSELDITCLLDMSDDDLVNIKDALNLVCLAFDGENIEIDRVSELKSNVSDRKILTFLGMLEQRSKRRNQVYQLD